MSILLLVTTIAALAAALGAIPLPGAAPVRDARRGWAGALAAGAMLGVAYAVMDARVVDAPVAVAGGATLGIVAMNLVHVGRVAAWRRVPEPALAAQARQAVAGVAWHSAAEGAALGVAFLLGTRFGGVLAATLAVHNISEGAVLDARLAPLGVGHRRAALLAIAAKSTQVLLGAAALLLVAAYPAALPWGLGFAFGALTYLLLAELLPESYRFAGRTSIAVVVSLAAGVAALLGNGLR